MLKAGVSSVTEGLSAKPCSVNFKIDTVAVQGESYEDCECPSPKVRLNEELNGYHFQYFREQFISRESLPRGSTAFQQVIEEITREINEINVSEKPKPTQVNNRRKSVANVIRRRDSSVFFRDLKAGQGRRISWGKPTYFTPDSGPAFNRARVSSDGAVVLKNAKNIRRTSIANN